MENHLFRVLMPLTKKKKILTDFLKLSPRYAFSCETARCWEEIMHHPWSKSPSSQHPLQLRGVHCGSWGYGCWLWMCWHWDIWNNEMFLFFFPIHQNPESFKIGKRRVAWWLKSLNTALKRPHQENYYELEASLSYSDSTKQKKMTKIKESCCCG